MASAAFTSASFLQRPYVSAEGGGGGGGEDDGVSERMYAWEGALDMSWVRDDVKEHGRGQQGRLSVVQICD